MNGSKLTVNTLHTTTTARTVVMGNIVTLLHLERRMLEVSLLESHWVLRLPSARLLQMDSENRP